MAGELKLQVFEDPPCFFDLQEPWLRLLQTLEGHPFLTPQWMGISFMYFFREGDLRLYALYDDDTLVGLFPLAVHPWDQVLRATTTAPYHVTDYVDVIVSQKYRKAFIERVFHDLRGIALDRPLVLDLPGIPGTSPTLWTLQQFAEAEEIPFQRFELTRAPVLRLPKTFEAYLVSLKSKDRHEIRRKVSRAHRMAELEIEVLSQPQDIAEGMEDFFALFALSCEEKKRFLTPEIQAFFAEVFPTMAHQGWVRLYFLQANGRRVSTFLVFDYGPTFYLYNSGFDPEYAALSPGIVLLTRIIEDAIEQGKAYLDFLRGQEMYKYRMGAKDVIVYRAVLGSVVPKDPDLEPDIQCSESFT